MSAGFLVAVAAAAGYELAYLLQALEARRAGGPAGDRSLLTRLARRPRWLGGLALSGLATGLQVLALALAPVTIVQPTLALGLVLLLFLAATVLGERVGRREVAGVAAVIAGVAVVAATAPPEGDVAVGAVGPIVLVAALAVLPVVAFVGRDALAPRWRVLAAALGDAAAAVALKGVATAFEHADLSAAVPWLAAAAATGGLALHAEMGALQRTAASHVAPVVLAAQVLIPVAAAPIVFGESWGSTPGGGIVLGAAVAVVAGGAALLGGSGPLSDYRRPASEAG